MIFPLWPPVAILALLMILLIMVILIYGDKIFARVKTHTERIGVRARPSLDPMMRMETSERGRYPQQQHPPPPPPTQQQFHQEIMEQRYSPQQQQHQFQQRYDAPMELQKQSTTYGHREIEV